jgi:hypothetical protein
MKQRIFLCAGMLAVLGSAVSARADITFTFDSITYATGNQDTAIAHYMDTLLGGTCATLFNCVTVTGLQSNGTPGGSVATDETYNGDGHVVSNTSGKSLTLGDSNGATSNSSTTPGATDIFLANTDDNRSQLSQGIEITFTTAVTLTGFDYEIFPDGTCPDLHSNDCGAGQSNLPDLVFKTNGTTQATFTGDAPCATVGGCQSQANSGKDGTSIHSPISGSGSTELAPQLIGTWTGSISGVTKIDFLDWPATIGVDNIKISSPTPEPTGGVFMIGGLFVLGFAGRKLRSVFGKS